MPRLESGVFHHVSYGVLGHKRSHLATDTEPQTELLATYRFDAQTIGQTRNILNFAKEERCRFLGREESLLLYNKPVGRDCDIAAGEVDLLHVSFRLLATFLRTFEDRFVSSA